MCFGQVCLVLPKQPDKKHSTSNRASFPLWEFLLSRRLEIVSTCIKYALKKLPNAGFSALTLSSSICSLGYFNYIGEDEKD